MILHRAFDANLQEMATKNVTPAVTERLTGDHYEPSLSASNIALAKLLLSVLKPTPHERYFAQRDLLVQLEGLKQGKGIPMEAPLHALKTDCWSRNRYFCQRHPHQETVRHGRYP